MEMLTPEEFFERIGVRVPNSVIRNLTEGRATIEVPHIGGPTLDSEAFDHAMDQLDLELSKVKPLK